MPVTGKGENAGSSQGRLQGILALGCVQEAEDVPMLSLSSCLSSGMAESYTVHAHEDGSRGWTAVIWVGSTIPVCRIKLHNIPTRTTWLLGEFF